MASFCNGFIGFLSVNILKNIVNVKDFFQETKIIFPVAYPLYPSRPFLLP